MYCQRAYEKTSLTNAAVLDMNAWGQCRKIEGDISTSTIYRPKIVRRQRTIPIYFVTVLGASTHWYLSDVRAIVECMGLRVLESSHILPEFVQMAMAQQHLEVVDFAIWRIVLWSDL